MEEHKSSLSPHEIAAARSAAALRGLQEHAQATLASSRQHAARLEAEINEKLDTIAATLNEQIVIELQGSAETDTILAEVNRLTSELERFRSERSELEAEREAYAQEANRAGEERESLVCKLTTAENAHTKLAGKLANLETERDGWKEQLVSLEADKAASERRIAQLESEGRSLADQLNVAEEERVKVGQQLVDLHAEHEALFSKNTELAAHSEEVSPQLVHLEAERDRLTGEVAGLVADRSAFREQVAALEQERAQLIDKVVALETNSGESARKITLLEGERDDLTQSATSYEARRAELNQKVEGLETEREKFTQTIAALKTELQTSQAEWRNQLVDFERRLQEQQSSWAEQRTEWAQARAEVECQRDEVQQKFDLALEDLQRLRARVDELEQDLSQRPESNQADSAELVALRAEREELATRLKELERLPSSAIDSDAEQQVADLQRRFELAVEDLRAYKTKCAKLETDLMTVNSRTHSAPADTGGNDWESQKRRLLAALEQSAEEQETQVEKQQRITIEETIEMTDAVVAEKDRQIAEMEAKLAIGHRSLDEVECSRKLNDLVEADEVIAEHRERVRQLEREMEDKLRTTELELSIERAKMARQKVELDELRSELETKKQTLEPTGGAVVPGQPKRRWRDKLGLSGGD